MLSLDETVKNTPVHVFYLGTEAQFLDELETLDHPVEDAEHLEFTCCNDTQDLLVKLHEFNAPRDNNVVVFGLLRHLEYKDEARPESVLRNWCAVLNTGVPRLQFGDTAASRLVDNLMSTKLE